MVRFVNQDLEVLPDFMRSDWIVPGLGDAGAHVLVIMDAVATSFLLSCWHRERGEFSLEEAVHLLTAKQARVIGLHDRGLVAVGNQAIINVIEI